MRIEKCRPKLLEADLTPMIDMTFLLIAFFMLIISFSETERDKELELPDSQVARPPDEPPKYQIIINMKTEEGIEEPIISFSNLQITGVDNIGLFLQQEINAAAVYNGGVPPAEIQIIIRADRNMPTVKVQDLMAKCQEYELQKFSFRAKEDIVKRNRQ